jgi:hypothetical protein
VRDRKHAIPKLLDYGGTYLNVPSKVNTTQNMFCDIIEHEL